MKTFVLCRISFRIMFRNGLPSDLLTSTKISIKVINTEHTGSGFVDLTGWDFYSNSSACVMICGMDKLLVIYSLK